MVPSKPLGPVEAMAGVTGLCPSSFMVDGDLYQQAEPRAAFAHKMTAAGQGLTRFDSIQDQNLFSFE